MCVVLLKRVSKCNHDGKLLSKSAVKWNSQFSSPAGTAGTPGAAGRSGPCRRGTRARWRSGSAPRSPRSRRRTCRHAGAGTREKVLEGRHAKIQAKGIIRDISLSANSSEILTSLAKTSRSSSRSLLALFTVFKKLN